MQFRSLLVTFITLTAHTTSAVGFDFNDPKGVNAISFVLDSPLEPIMGLANGISGTIAFDSENPHATTGTIIVDAASLRTSNSRMTEVLHGEKWLDIAKNKEIGFTFGKVNSVQQLGNTEQELSVTGDFSLMGVSKSITVPVRLAYLPDKLGVRGGPIKKGDLLLLRCNFRISRSDFNIRQGQSLEKVADKIEIRMALAGGAPK